MRILSTLTVALVAISSVANASNCVCTKKVAKETVQAKVVTGKSVGIPKPRCNDGKYHRATNALFAKHGSTLVRTGFINGLPGFVTREADGELQTTALEIEDGKVVAIYVVRNPDKLVHLH